MPYYIDMYSNESGTKISYTLRWSALPAFKNTIYKMQEHEIQKETLPDFEIDLSLVPDSVFCLHIFVH